MKRLKLQKALLAICLALPITLTTSNGINAMQQTDLQTEQKSNNNEPNETKNTTDQFPQQITQYIKKAKKDKKTLTEQEYIEFLQKYIKDDPQQYLSLLIKSTYFKLNNPKNRSQQIKTPVLHKALFSYIGLEDPSSKQTDGQTTDQKTLIIETQNEQFTTIIEQIKHIINKEDTALNQEEKIIKLLIHNPTFNFKDTLSLTSFIDAIKEYTRDRYNTIVDEKYSTFIRFLAPVQQQLQQELDNYQAYHQTDHTQQLSILAKYLKQFREQYNTKLYKKTNPTQVGQQILKKLLPQIQNKSIKKAFKKIRTKCIKATHTSYFKYITSIEQYSKLSPAQYKEKIKNYITDNPVKYLALLIQAKEGLIQFPPEREKDILLNSDKIHKMLLNKGAIPIDPSELMGTKEKIQEIQDIQAALQTIKHTESEQLTAAQKIIALLFLKDGNLNDLIANYKNSEPKEELYPYCYILSLLEEVAKQLITEADDLYDDESKHKLIERAKQIQNFITVYKTTTQKPRQKIHNNNKNNQQETASKSTLTQALNNPDYIQNQPILRDDTVLKNLKDYIDNKPAKYLAAMIQANYKLIQFSTDKFKYPTIGPKFIYEMLFPDVNYPQNQIQFIDDGATKEALTKILKYIISITGKNELSAANEIILQLIPAPRNSAQGDTQDRINKLTKLIEEYKTQPYKEEGTTTERILSLLGEIATQLEQEAGAGNNTPENNQITALAQQIRSFSDAYTRKKQEEERKKKQEEERKAKEEQEKLKKEKEEKERLRREEEERTKKAKEEEERKKKQEEKEQKEKEKEEEEKQRKKEVEERLKKEQEEKQRKKEVEERLKKEQEEKQRKKEVEERLKKEQEEKQRKKEVEERLKKEKEEQAVDIKVEDNKEEKINTDKKEDPAEQTKEPIINKSISINKVDGQKSIKDEAENKKDVKSMKDKTKGPDIKAGKDKPKKECKDTQTENEKSDDTDIKEIEKLINDWIKQKEDTNKDKEAKLTKLEQDINSLENKYTEIVNGDKESLL